jgi:hypothetical protein
MGTASAEKFTKLLLGKSAPNGKLPEFLKLPK